MLEIAPWPRGRLVAGKSDWWFEVGDHDASILSRKEAV